MSGYHSSFPTFNRQGVGASVPASASASMPDISADSKGFTFVAMDEVFYTDKLQETPIDKNGLPETVLVRSGDVTTNGSRAFWDEDDSGDALWSKAAADQVAAGREVLQMNGSTSSNPDFGDLSTHGWGFFGSEAAGIFCMGKVTGAFDQLATEYVILDGEPTFVEVFFDANATPDDMDKYTIKVDKGTNVDVSCRSGDTFAFVVERTDDARKIWTYSTTAGEAELDEASHNADDDKPQPLFQRGPLPVERLRTRAS